MNLYCYILVAQLRILGLLGHCLFVYVLLTLSVAATKFEAVLPAFCLLSIYFAPLPLLQILQLGFSNSISLLFFFLNRYSIPQSKTLKFNFMIKHSNLCTSYARSYHLKTKITCATLHLPPVIMFCVLQMDVVVWPSTNVPQYYNTQCSQR